MNSYSALRIGTPGTLMKKQTTKPIRSVETVKPFSKPALGECALFVASALLCGCAARGHFNGRSRAISPRTDDHATFESLELEFANSER